MNYKFITLLIVAIIASSCGNDKAKKESVKVPAEQEATTETKKTDPMSDKGIGPVKNVTIGEINPTMVTEGEAIFKAKCSACHKISKRFIGPGMKGVTQRRTPEWIMNMILNPEEMVQKNTIAKQLLAEYNAPMANQSLTEDEARKILEYFRTKN